MMRSEFAAAQAADVLRLHKSPALSYPVSIPRISYQQGFFDDGLLSILAFP
jgi:hypothetical protein